MKTIAKLIGALLGLAIGVAALGATLFVLYTYFLMLLIPGLQAIPFINFCIPAGIYLVYKGGKESLKQAQLAKIQSRVATEE